MQQLYLETRHLPAQPPMTVAADIARHLQRRQNLGRALIVCDNPTSLLSAVRKQWLKNARQIQRLRASTLNAEEILRLTHAVMHMHNMHFTSKTPADVPQAVVYVNTPGQLKHAPLNCFTFYLAAPVPAATFNKICAQLPEGALLVQYTSALPAANLELKPKETLEQNLLAQWAELTAFLRQHGITPDKLVVGNVLQFDAMDEALDILLGVSESFLRLVTYFQHTINLAQPFVTITNVQQKKFEAVTRLAHRVQALAPGDFGGFLNTSFYDSALDMYFLSDVSSELYDDMEMAAAAILDAAESQT